MVEDARSDDVATVVGPAAAHVHGSGAPDLEDEKFNQVTLNDVLRCKDLRNIQSKIPLIATLNLNQIIRYFRH